MPGVRAPVPTSGSNRSRVLRACAAVASCLTFVSTTLADELEARVAPLVEATMRDGRIPGLALAVVHGGKPVLVKGYGYANLEHEVPVTPETIFQSGSVGKQFTAVVVMMQVEAGKLDLDAPITRYFRDAPSAWQAVHARHLLTHTSGIPDYTDEHVDLRRDYTEDELVNVAYKLPLEFKP